MPDATCTKKSVANIEESHVRVQIDPWRARSDGATERTLNNIARDIRRHVDDLYRVDVVIPRQDVCSACGCGWEPGPDIDDPTTMICLGCGAVVVVEEARA